jgi:2-phosphosulfolactate phosphatase
MTCNQAEFDVRCEWGEKGVSSLVPIRDAVILVDVISFSTADVVATARDALVYPYRWKEDSRIGFAKSIDAELAGPRGKANNSPSPVSLMSLPRVARLVLSSLNGATLSLATGDWPAFAGCLRNAMLVAQAAARLGTQVAIVPCGERWKEDGSLRPALEDFMGTGAIISHLSGTLSPEAQAAIAAFHAAEPNLCDVLKHCSSGNERMAMGFEGDIPPTAEVDVDHCVPILKKGSLQKGRTSRCTPRLRAARERHRWMRDMNE